MTQEYNARTAREMLDVLGADGSAWIKGTVHNSEKTRFCMLGAYQRAIELRNGRFIGWYSDFVNALADAVRQEYPERAPRPRLPGADPTCITGFNDHDATTWEDVALVLKKMGYPDEQE